MNFNLSDSDPEMDRYIQEYQFTNDGFCNSDSEQINNSLREINNDINNNNINNEKKDDAININLENAINATEENMIPVSSKKQYLETWEAFLDWQKNLPEKYNIEALSEQIHIYLADMWKNGTWKSASTLWSKFSIIRTMTRIKLAKVITGEAGELKIVSWLKSIGKIEKPKQSESFEPLEIKKYLDLVSNDESLILDSLICLIGVNIGCRAQTLYQLQFKNFYLHTDGDLRIEIDYAQKHDQRGDGHKWILKKCEDINYCPVTNYKKYVKIAEEANLNESFFWRPLYFGKNKKLCIKNSRIGINYISSLPKKIAKILNLKNPEKYTGHAFRRTCAMWQANKGASDQEMRLHFGWKNTSMASRYTSISEVVRENAANRTCLDNSNKLITEKNSKFLFFILFIF